MKVRLKKLVTWATTLEYIYSTPTGEIRGYDNDLKPVTHQDYIEGKSPKKRKFDANTSFIDINVNEKELAILREHSQVKWAGNNPNLTNPIYELIDVGKQQNEKVQEIKKMRRVMNFVDGLDIKSIYNLCHYLQLDVTGKDMNEIYTILLNPISGVAYANYDNVVSIENDEDAELKIVVNKGLVMNLIQMKGTEYFYGNKMVAGSLPELYYYFKNANDLYEKGLKKAVEEKEIDLPVTIQYAENFEAGRALFNEKSESKRNVEELTPELIEWAKTKANELDIKGKNLMRPENLVAAVLKKESAIAEWEQHKKKMRAAK
jgi:hypothetical protein